MHANLCFSIILGDKLERDNLFCPPFIVKVFFFNQWVDSYVCFVV